jgi:ADP-ribose pyrophosphatase YjhB (NUDIX family)
MIKKAIKNLEKHAGKPGKGLPEELFLFVSRMTPIVNVDLLIKDKKGRTLLSWRDDKIDGKGWHVPGGIVRFREKFGKRIGMVARNEIGTTVKCGKMPVAMHQIILKQKERAHFISFLYKCSVRDGFKPANRGLKPGDAGFLKWHGRCPENILKVHRIYRKLINEGREK